MQTASLQFDRRVEVATLRRLARPHAEREWVVRRERDSELEVPSGRRRVGRLAVVHREAQVRLCLPGIELQRPFCGRALGLERRLRREQPLAPQCDVDAGQRRGNRRIPWLDGLRKFEVGLLAAVQRANLGIYLLAAGRLREAEEAFRLAQDLNPALADTEIVLALILQHRPAAALERILRWPPGASQDQALALAYEGLGRTHDAQLAFDRLRANEEPIGALRLAEVLALRGEREAAFRGLERARRSCDGQLASPGCERVATAEELRLSPFLAGLRDDPRWEQLFTRS